MNKLLAALRAKFRTPAEALAALGLDEDLLNPDDTKPVIIAHDEAWETTTTKRRTTVTTQEQRLIDALRRRFRGGPLAVLRRLGMDQSELDPPDADEPTDSVGALLKQFGQLSDEDKSSFLEAIGQMANGDAGVGYRNPSNARPQAMDGAPARGSFAQRWPSAMRIGYPSR